MDVFCKQPVAIYLWLETMGAVKLKKGTLGIHHTFSYVIDLFIAQTQPQFHDHEDGTH